MSQCIAFFASCLFVLARYWASQRETLAVLGMLTFCHSVPMQDTQSRIYGTCIVRHRKGSKRVSSPKDVSVLALFSQFPDLFLCEASMILRNFGSHIRQSDYSTWSFLQEDAGLIVRQFQLKPPFTWSGGLKEIRQAKKLEACAGGSGAPTRLKERESCG